jgi:enoyl-CoA hydratase/carnithine racemase
MSYETILFETRGPIGLLTFNRPDRLNAFSQPMIDEVNRQLDLVERDENIRVLVVAGAGRAFSAGFDLKDGADRPWGTVADVTATLKKDFDFIMRFWHFSRPTIAAVHGYALAGACELAMACDITIAADGTRFGEPELRFGSGMVALLMPWLSGPKKAKEFLLTGNDRIDAVEALACGLINRVVPLGQELPSALALACEIALNDRVKVAMTKRAINRGYEIMGMLAALDMGLDTDIQIEALQTPEGKEFKAIAKRDGLKAALVWRDARFAAPAAGSEPAGS